VTSVLDAQRLSDDVFTTSTLATAERIRTTLTFYDYAGKDPINGYDLDGTFPGSGTTQEGKEGARKGQ